LVYKHERKGEKLEAVEERLMEEEIEEGRLTKKE